MSLYSRQEESQRKIMHIFKRRFTEAMKKTKGGGIVIDVPTYIVERLEVDLMKRDVLELEYAKVTQE